LSLDVLVIGAGHNGLVCAAYLAAAGLDVGVLEQRDVVGGAAVTEEFFPGFRNSTASYTVSLLQPKIIRDLRLEQHGLRIVERPFSNFMPLEDGNYLRTGATFEETQHEFARHSQTDAQRLGDYYAMLERAVPVIREWVLRTPPNTKGIGNTVQAALAVHRLHGLPPATQRDLLELFTRSAGDLLDHYFETDAIKALFGFDSIVGSFASPYTPGSAYVLLHHVFGQTNGKSGTWGHAIGGMGAITQAMLAEARARGVTVRTGARVEHVLVEHGEARGVVLADGEIVRARRIAANVNPKLLYTRLLDADVVAPELRTRMQRYRCASGSFRMNVALSELPRFESMPENIRDRAMQSGIIIGSSLGYMERAYFDARLEGFSRAPVVELLVPSTLDDTLAPPGRHVASLFCQHFDPVLPADASWDDRKQAAIDCVIDTVDRYAPNFRASILGLQALSPLDLERTFGLTGGDIFHGALSLDQLFSARPLLGYADYRTPIAGLYLCGSGAHPGGGVTGAPGHNAAREILRDVRRRFTRG
jgi:phytoene dehydrogenase-like protein